MPAGLISGFSTSPWSPSLDSSRATILPAPPRSSSYAPMPNGVTRTSSSPALYCTAYEYATRGMAFAVRTFGTWVSRDDGLAVLVQAARVAWRYGLGHHLRSFEGIRKCRQG